MSNSPGLVIVRQSSKHIKHTSLKALRGTPLRGRLLVAAHCSPGELKGSHFRPLFIGSQDRGFSHYNVSCWTQSGSAISLKVWEQECYAIQTKKIFFQGRWWGKQELLSSFWEQTVFLISPGRAKPRCCFQCWGLIGISEITLGPGKGGEVRKIHHHRCSVTTPQYQEISSDYNLQFWRSKKEATHYYPESFCMSFAASGFSKKKK